MSIYLCNVCQIQKDNDQVTITECQVCGEGVCENCLAEHDDICIDCYSLLVD